MVSYTQVRPISAQPSYHCVEMGPTPSSLQRLHTKFGLNQLIATTIAFDNYNYCVKLENILVCNRAFSPAFSLFDAVERILLYNLG